MHFVSMELVGMKFACVAALVLIALHAARERAHRANGAARATNDVALPTSLVQSVVLVTAAAVVAFLGLMATASLYSDAAFASRAILLCELALLSLWLVPALALRRHLARASSLGKPVSRWVEVAPRAIACVGLAGQLAIFATAAKYRCAPEAVALRDLGSRGGAVVLTLVVLGSALAYCYRIRREQEVRVPSVNWLAAFLRSRASATESPESPPVTSRSRVTASSLACVPAAIILGGVPFSEELCVEPNRAGVLGLPASVDLLADGAGCPRGSELLQILSVDARALSLMFVLALALFGLRASRARAESRGAPQRTAGSGATDVALLATLLTLSMLAARVLYGSWDLARMVRWQAEHAWGAFIAPAVLLAWLVSALRARSVLVARARARALPFVGFLERFSTVALSALVVVVFFGGSSIPFLSRAGVELRLGETLITTQLMPHPLLIALGVLGFVAKLVVVTRVAGVAGTALEARADKQTQLGRGLLALGAVNAGLIAVGQKFGAVGSLSKLLTLLGDLSMALVAVAAPLLAVYLLVTHRAFERPAPRSGASASDPAPVELSAVEARAHLS